MKVDIVQSEQLHDVCLKISPYLLSMDLGKTNISKAHSCDYYVASSETIVTYKLFVAKWMGVGTNRPSPISNAGWSIRGLTEHSITSDQLMREDVR